MKQNQKLQESLVVEICVCLVKLVGSGKSGAGRNYGALLHIADVILSLCESSRKTWPETEQLL